jgi:hypothetical protein
VDGDLLMEFDLDVFHYLNFVVCRVFIPNSVSSNSVADRVLPFFNELL